MSWKYTAPVDHSADRLWAKELISVLGHRAEHSIPYADRGYRIECDDFGYKTVKNMVLKFSAKPESWGRVFVETHHPRFPSSELVISLSKVR